MKYPKIQSLWKRDANEKYIIMEGDYSKEEFRSIRFWSITEKIDGTNIRVLFNGESVEFRGRTDNAQIPATLVANLIDTFLVENLKKQFPDSTDVILYGEGYGPKIQKGGGLYREDTGFILFDVVVHGIWLTRDSVTDIANKLCIDLVPLLPLSTVTQAIDYVKSFPKSVVAKQEKEIEGVVARAEPLVLYRDGTPVMWKLKCNDYHKLESIKENG